MQNICPVRCHFIKHENILQFARVYKIPFKAFNYRQLKNIFKQDIKLCIKNSLSKSHQNTFWTWGHLLIVFSWPCQLRCIYSSWGYMYRLIPAHVGTMGSA